MTISSFDDKSTLWAAYCSSLERTPETCLAYTLALLAETTEADELCRSISGKLFSAHINRGADKAFIDALLSIGNRQLALGCVHSMVDGVMRGALEAHEATACIDAYVTRYGEDEALLLHKLRLLTLYDQYAHSAAEVERILGVLQPASGGTAVSSAEA